MKERILLLKHSKKIILEASKFSCSEGTPSYWCWLLASVSLSKRYQQCDLTTTQSMYEMCVIRNYQGRRPFLVRFAHAQLDCIVLTNHWIVCLFNFIS